jgi:centromere/kinetochore protein ZW10
LPVSGKHTFLKFLSKPLTKGLLNHLLIPHLPSSLSSLPGYLELVARAIRFEDEDLCKVLRVTGEAEIRSWTDGVVSHYEKKRRIDILDRCRQILVKPQDVNSTFRAEASDPYTKNVQEDTVPEAPTTSKNGLGITVGEAPEATVEVDEDGWGFEEEVVPEADTEVTEEDAWGWNDNTSPVENGNGGEPVWDAWDDPPPSNGNVPKVAKRLEGLSSKSSPKANGANGSSAAGSSPLLPIKASGKPPEPPSPPPVVKELYLVSSLTKEITALVEAILHEGEELSRSKLFSSLPTPSVSPGTLILQTAPSLLDLFRLLYPVTFAAELSNSSERRLRFSNDCLYLSGQIHRISRLVTVDQGAKNKLHECQDKLEVFGQSWFEHTIVSAAIIIIVSRFKVIAGPADC